jgi:peptidase YpeB-like protein
MRRNIAMFDRSDPMRKFILPIVAALALGAAAPALAYDSGDQMSMQAAIGVANQLGIMTVSNTEFLGDEWEIEGRDGLGRWMKVDVDAQTGEVRNVDRGW